MGDATTWVVPEMKHLGGRRRPDFVDDARFTAAWWGQSGVSGPPDYEWRSYIQRGEEVARLLLGLKFSTHSLVSPSPALLIWNFEVREDLRCNGTRIGTAIVTQLVSDYCDREIYAAASGESEMFWARLGWRMCDCDECDGRDFMVRRP